MPQSRTEPETESESSPITPVKTGLEGGTVSVAKPEPNGTPPDRTGLLSIPMRPFLLRVDLRERGRPPYAQHAGRNGQQGIAVG
jgi:hypothetical protein